MKNITKDSLKDQIDLKNGSEGFIKVTDNPVSSLNSEQKVILNRKGNILFNQGDIESARRIFTTTDIPMDLQESEIYTRRKMRV